MSSCDRESANLIKVLPSIIAPLISVACLMLSNGYFLTFVSAKLHLDHYSSLMIGIIQASYYAGFLIAAIKSESLIQRIRHIRAFSFFASISTAATLLTAYIHTPILWIISRFIMGVSIAALYVVIESWLLTISSVKNRGVILATYMIALYLAQSLSQYFMDLVEIESLSPFIIASFLASVSILPVTFTRSSIPELPKTEGKKVFSFLMIAPMGTIGAIISGMILASIYTFVPNYAQEANISISYIMSIIVAGGFLLQYPIGKLSDLVDRRKILLLAAIFTIISSLAVIVFSSHQGAILISAFILGGFSFTIYPLSITQVIDRCQEEEITTVTGVMLFAYSVGAVVGPLLTPLFIYLFGTSGTFVSVLILSCILSIIGFYMVFTKRPMKKKDQEKFIPLPPQTPVSYDLDPRSEE